MEFTDSIFCVPKRWYPSLSKMHLMLILTEVDLMLVSFLLFRRIFSNDAIQFYLRHLFVISLHGKFQNLFVLYSSILYRCRQNCNSCYVKWLITQVKFLIVSNVFHNRNGHCSTILFSYDSAKIRPFEFISRPKNSKI